MEELLRVESYAGSSTMSERWNIMYNEQNRSPIYSVQHYISYLRKHVAETGYARTARSTPASSNGSRTRPAVNRGASRESMSPVSYFLRKLKLDLKLAYANFVTEFVKAPNNGLRLLLSLLKNLQVLSSKSIGSLPRSEGRGTLRMDEYKRNMVDEQDCLLCIKYTLRNPDSTDELLEDNSGLLSVARCLISNYSKSRVTALEILTLIITGPSSVDKVLDAFTSIRLQYGESTRFKMLTNMMQTRGVPHVLFQVNCLRLLNSLLNMCRSSNMRVFLQYEMEEAGLNMEHVRKNAQGDGLEYDDLRKEIQEWKIRYIDVDTLLRKIKHDMKREFQSESLSEFCYDQKYGIRSNHGAVPNDLNWVTPHANGYFIDYDKWIQYVQSKQKEHNSPMQNGQSADAFLRRDVYIPDPFKPHKTLTSQSQLTDDKIPSPTQFSNGKYKFGHHRENEETSLYDVISITTSVCGSDNALDVNEDQQGVEGCQNRAQEIKTKKVAKGSSASIKSQPINGFRHDENWILQRSGDKEEKLTSSEGSDTNIIHTLQNNAHTQERMHQHDSGVSINYYDPDSHGHSHMKPTLNKPVSYSHIFYTGDNSDKHQYQESFHRKSNGIEQSENFKRSDVQKLENTNNKSQYNQFKPISNQQSHYQSKTLVHQSYHNSAFKPIQKYESDISNQGNYPKNAHDSRQRGFPSNRIRTPSPDYTLTLDEKTVIHPLKTSTTRYTPTAKRPDAQSLQNHQNRTDFTSKTSSPMSNGEPLQSKAKPVAEYETVFNNLSPKQNPYTQMPGMHNQCSKNSRNSNITRKKSVFDDKVILNVTPSHNSEMESKNHDQSSKRQNEQLSKAQSFPSPERISHETEDGRELYANEVNKVLQGLDKTLEQHGWKDTVTSVKSTKVPFVAYI